MVEMFPILKIVYFQNEQDNLFSFFYIYLVFLQNLIQLERSLISPQISLLMSIISFIFMQMFRKIKLASHQLDLFTCHIRGSSKRLSAHSVAWKVVFLIFLKFFEDSILFTSLEKQQQQFTNQRKLKHEEHNTVIFLNSTTKNILIDSCFY